MVLALMKEIAPFKLMVNYNISFIYYILQLGCPNRNITVCKLKFFSKVLEKS